MIRIGLAYADACSLPGISKVLAPGSSFKPLPHSYRGVSIGSPIVTLLILLAASTNLYTLIASPGNFHFLSTFTIHNLL